MSRSVGVKPFNRTLVRSRTRGYWVLDGGEWASAFASVIW